MGGNVAEWVADVYRPIIDEANDFNYFRGNLYTKPIIDENGRVTADNLKIANQIERLPNGRINLKFPGELVQKVLLDDL